MTRRLLVILLLLAAGPALAEKLVFAMPAEEANSPTTIHERFEFSLKVMREVGRRAGYDFEFRTMPFPRCLEEVKQGRVDGGIGFLRTPEREKFADYSREGVTLIQQAIFKVRGRQVAVGPDFAWLTGKRVGIINNTTHGRALDAAIHGAAVRELVLAEDYDQLVRMVASGRIDFAVSPRDTMVTILARLGLGDEVVELPVGLEPLPTHVIFTRARDMRAARQHVDEALAAMKADGTFSTLHK